MANEISLERRDGGVAVLTLDASGRRNALTVEMAGHLVDACDELDADHDVGAVVVRGEGGFFCAGGDRATLEAAGEDPADSGFLPIGLHPGGGHGALLGRTGVREAAAAMALFGERIDGERAAALGLAWIAVDDRDVEETALELAARAGADPELARRTAASLRTVLGPPAIPWHAALELERASQMWSMRRKALG